MQLLSNSDVYKSFYDSFYDSVCVFSSTVYFIIVCFIIVLCILLYYCVWLLLHCIDLLIIFFSFLVSVLYCFIIFVFGANKRVHNHLLSVFEVRREEKNGLAGDSFSAADERSDTMGQLSPFSRGCNGKKLSNVSKIRKSRSKLNTRPNFPLIIEETATVACLGVINESLIALCLILAIARSIRQVIFISCAKIVYGVIMIIIVIHFIQRYHRISNNRSLFCDI